MTEPSNSDVTRALKAVEDVNPGYTDFVLIFTQPSFMNGSLYVVKFSGKDGKSYENHVYFTGDKIKVAKNLPQFVEMMSQESSRSNWLSIFLTAGGLVWILALIITLTIVGLFLQGRTEIPQVLSASLSVILGYYFGSKHPSPKLA